MLAYNLENNISIEKLTDDINRLVENFKKNNPDRIPILYIDIRSIVSDDTSHILKLKYNDCIT